MTAESPMPDPLTAESDYWRAYVVSHGPGAAARIPYLGRPARLAPAAAPTSPEHGAPHRTERSASWPSELAGQLARLAAGRDADVPALEQSLRSCAAQPSAGGALVVGVGGRGGALALCRAVADGRPFLGVLTLADLDVRRVHDTGAQSVYVVAEYATLEQVDRIVQEAHRCRDAAGRPLPLGFLHAADFPMMTYLDAKQRLAACARPERPDLLIDATATVEPVLERRLQVLPYRDATAADLRARQLDLLALTVHGMSDLLHLNDDYICGKSRIATADSTATPPACMTSGGCFHKPGGQPLRAFEIDAHHIFVNSCGSLRFNRSDFGTQFDIWYTALEGRTLSYCGTLRWKEGSGIEALLYQKLLRAGYTLGAACSAVNAALPSLGAEVEPVFALLGDPSYRPHPADAPVAQRVSPGLSDIDLHEGFAEARLGDSACLETARRGTLAVHGHGSAPTLSAYVPTESAVTIFVLGVDGRSGPAPVEVSDLSDARSYYQDIAEALSQSIDPALGLGGLYPDKAKGAIRRDLESRLLHIARLEHERYQHPTAARRLLRSVEQLRRRVDELDAEIANWLATRLRSTTYRFAEQYAGACLISVADPGPECPYCAGPTHLRRLRHAARPQVTRTETICGACGGIFDHPDDVLSCAIRLDPVAQVAAKAGVEVEIRNSGPLRREGYCVYGLRKTAALDIEHGEAVQKFSIAGGETEYLSFSFCAGVTSPAHQFDLQVATVSAGRLYLARRNVWLAGSPQRAWSPPRHAGT